MTTAIGIPEIKSVGDTYLLTWQNIGIQVKLNRLVEKAEGVSSELVITKGGGHLYQARVNLLSPTSKRALAGEMQTRVNGIDWRVIIEQAFAKTLEAYRKGEPVIQVGNLPRREAPRYRLKPFILEGEMCALYAFGGSGKSALSDLIAVSVQCGVQVCGLAPIKGNVLILDWETSKETVDERVKAIKKGMNISSPELPFYRRCFHVLASDIYEIQEEVARKNIKLVIVDSANMASGVSQDFHGPAQAMLAALRSLQVSILIIDHKPKTGETMFGTVIKFNSCRSAWELKGSQEEGSNLLNMKITHTKHNDTPKFRDLGFEVEFIGNDDITESIIFKRKDVSEMQEFFAELPLKERIIAILRHHNRMEVKAIADELADGTNEASVRVVLNRNKNLFVRLPTGEWGLLASGTGQMPDKPTLPIQGTLQ